MRRQSVVQRNSDAAGNPWAALDNPAYICFKREVAAFMLHNLHSIHPHDGVVVGTAEPEHHPGAEVVLQPTLRNQHLLLIPHPSDVVFQVGVLSDVIEAGGHWHVNNRTSLPERLPVPALLEAGVPARREVGAEAPDSSELLQLAGGALAGVQHAAPHGRRRPPGRRRRHQHQQLQAAPIFFALRFLGCICLSAEIQASDFSPRPLTVILNKNS